MPLLTPTPTLIGTQPPEALEVIIMEVVEHMIPCVKAAEQWRVLGVSSIEEAQGPCQVVSLKPCQEEEDHLGGLLLHLRLLGAYQVENLTTAITVIQTLSSLGSSWPLSAERLAAGLGCVRGMDVPARATCLQREGGGLLLADGAHNEVAAASLAEVIDQTVGGDEHAGRGCCLLMAGSAGHNIAGIAKLLLPKLASLRPDHLEDHQDSKARQVPIVLP